MKILFTFGGLPHYYNSILNKLNEIENIEIQVLKPAKKSTIIGSGVHQTNKGVRFKNFNLVEYKSYYGKPFFKDIYNLLKNEKPQIIVTIWPYILGFIFYPKLFWLIKSKRIKIILKEIPFQIPKYNEAKNFYKEGYVFTEENGYSKINTSFITSLKYIFLTYLRKLYFNFADAHVDYIEEAKDIIGSYGVDREKIFIIYNSPDTDKLLSECEKIKDNNDILPSNPHRLIHVGRLVKWKRVDLLIQTFKKVKDQYIDAELIIIGNGPEENNLKKMTLELGIENSVNFVGAVYDSKLLGKYLLASTIYVLAGMGGLSINEAMCFKKPIICSVCDGTEKKLVRENYNGKYFKLNDTEDLFNKIDYLFSRPELLKKMQENSLKIIKEEINVDAVIKGYLDAFRYVTRTV